MTKRTVVCPNYAANFEGLEREHYLNFASMYEPSPLPWYGIRTKSNCEWVAAQSLESKGFQQFLPVYKSRRHWSDRIIEKERPLFPGYVFCRFDALKRLPIVMTPGVVRIVSFGGAPTPIDSDEIEMIRSIVDSGLAAEPFPYLSQGDRVRIMRGPLKSVEGILLKKKSELRVVVSVPMLQRSISIEVDSSWLRPA